MRLMDGRRRGVRAATATVAMLVSIGAMTQLSDGTVLLILLISTAVIIPIALAAFALFIRRARQLGLLDMLTGT